MSRMDHQRVTDRILLTVAILLFLYISFQRSCDGDGITGKTDTLYVKGKPDTVIVYDTTFKEVVKPVAVRAYVYVHDTVNSPETAIISGQLENPCDSIRIYTDSIEDGTCKVILKDSVRGELLGWSAELRSRKMEISRVDTMKITSTPDRLKIGAGIGYSNQPFPYLHLSRGRIQGLAGYQIKDKSLLLGVGWQIR